MRATQTRPAAPDPAWLTAFLDDLARAGLAPATRRGYGYGLRHLLAWHAGIRGGGFALERLAEHDLIAYRQHLLAASRILRHVHDTPLRQAIQLQLNRGEDLGEGHLDQVARKRSTTKLAQRLRNLGYDVTLMPKAA